jgi:hypothetical protein
MSIPAPPDAAPVASDGDSGGGTALKRAITGPLLYLFILGDVEVEVPAPPERRICDHRVGDASL